MSDTVCILIQMDRRDVFIKAIQKPNLGMVKMRYKVKKKSRHYRLEWTTYSDPLTSK